MERLALLTVDDDPKNAYCRSVGEHRELLGDGLYLHIRVGVTMSEQRYGWDTVLTALSVYADYAIYHFGHCVEERKVSRSVPDDRWAAHTGPLLTFSLGEHEFDIDLFDTGRVFENKPVLEEVMKKFWRAQARKRQRPEPQPQTVRFPKYLRLRSLPRPLTQVEAPS